MTWTHLFLVPWVLFAVVWAASAFFTRATIKRESAAARASYGAPLVLGCVLIFSHAFSPQLPWLETQLVPGIDSVRTVGFLLCVGGLVFAIWARAALGKMWSGTITLKEGHHLVQAGPYALARHPIYTGIGAGLLGTALALGTLRAAVGLVLAIASFIYKLGHEERLMAEHFPAEHAQYRTRVKRLVPFVW